MAHTNHLNLIDRVTMLRDQRIRVRVLRGKPYFVATDVASFLGYSGGSSMVRTFAGIGKQIRMARMYGKDGARTKRQIWLISFEGVMNVLDQTGSPLRSSLAAHLSSTVLPNVAKTTEENAGKSFKPGSEAVDISTSKSGVIQTRDRPLTDTEKARATKAMQMLDQLRKISKA